MLAGQLKKGAEESYVTESLCSFDLVESVTHCCVEFVKGIEQVCVCYKYYVEVKFVVTLLWCPEVGFVLKTLKLCFVELVLETEMRAAATLLSSLL